MPLGGDCAKYLEKELKSPPRLGWLNITSLTYVFLCISIGLYYTRKIIPLILPAEEERGSSGIQLNTMMQHMPEMTGLVEPCYMRPENTIATEDDFGIRVSRHERPPPSQNDDWSQTRVGINKILRTNENFTITIKNNKLFQLPSSICTCHHYQVDQPLITHA
jgi:hypothetical protein